MDSFFGIGAPELILILLLAGLVMGPRRISQVARWMGKTTAKLQAVSRHFMRQLNAELAVVDESGDLKEAMDDIQALRRQISDLRQELIPSAANPIKEGQAALKAVKTELGENPPILISSPPITENRIAPPMDLPALPNPINIADDPE